MKPIGNSFAQVFEVTSSIRELVSITISMVLKDGVFNVDEVVKNKPDCIPTSNCPRVESKAFKKSLSNP